MSDSSEPVHPPSLATRYDALYEGSGFGDAPKFYRWIAALADPGRSATVLDVGCGAGGALAAFAEREVPAIGLDFSATALSHAQTALRSSRGSPPRLLRADGTRLPFASNSVDVLLNLGNLEHFADLAAGIREMHRVLALDGRAFVLLPNLFYSGVIWRVLWGGEGPNHHQPIDRFATRSEWQAWLEWGGLRVERTLPYHKGKRWKRLLPRAFAWHFLFQCTRGVPNDGPPPPAPLGRTEPGLDRSIGKAPPSR